MPQITLPPVGETGRVILVSGWRLVGKTTLLAKVREAALRTGLRVGGFLSLARFEAGQKTGIDLMDAATGTVLPLAVSGDTGPVRTGHYSFEPETLAVGLLWAETGHDADVFFVDELGPLELKRGEGWSAVLPMIRARAFGVAFVVVRPELVDLAREQLTLSTSSPLVTVETACRDSQADEIMAWIVQRQPR